MIRSRPFVIDFQVGTGANKSVVTVPPGFRWKLDRMSYAQNAATAGGLVSIKGGAIIIPIWAPAIPGANLPAHTDESHVLDPGWELHVNTPVGVFGFFLASGIEFAL